MSRISIDRLGDADADVTIDDESWWCVPVNVDRDRVTVAWSRTKHEHLSLHEIPNETARALNDALTATRAEDAEDIGDLTGAYGARGAWR